MYESFNYFSILPFCTKNIKKLKNFVLSWQNLNASLRSVLAISEYFMLIQCLRNIGESLLHACVSSNNNYFSEVHTIA